MALKVLIKPGEYHDSIQLMLAARALGQAPGVQDAAVVMGTDANKSILASAGMLTDSMKAAGANDLVIAVRAEVEADADAALRGVDDLLKPMAADDRPGEIKPRTLRAALSQQSDSNVAVISVAGQYAADEAREALERGLHVLLFSDHVSLEDEIALKKQARDRGLLLMGPGAGTAILNGTALGFANVIPAGPIGIVSAAGTGLQEVSSLIARHGSGITQGIGVGGRDLKREVGGIMMLEALAALQEDRATDVIVLVSKPPAAEVAQSIIKQASKGGKPTVICFLGGDVRSITGRQGLMPARTLQEAAFLALAQVKAGYGSVESGLQAEDRQLADQAQSLRQELAPGQKYLRGLYSGGTLCYEAQVVWKNLSVGPIHSNAPLPGGSDLAAATKSCEHSAVDMGEEEFTSGRLHPMMDQDLRVRRILQESRDPQVAAIVLDVVLGYGAHPDPASELGPAVKQARQEAQAAGRTLHVIASVTGTEADPQCLSRVSAELERAGAMLCECNAAAARLAAHLVGDR